jgi:Domain of unknown function (DUF4158)
LRESDFLGFCPDDLGTAPEAVVAFMARQLDVAPAELARYGRRGQTRTEHLRLIRLHLGFRKATAGDLTDEALDLFDHCLAEAYDRARRDLEDFRLSVASATNEKVRLFREIGRVVLDPAVRDADLQRVIYRRIPPAELRDAVEETDRIIRQPDDHYFDFLKTRYTYLRQFTPEFIDALAFRSTGNSSLLRAVDQLRRLNAERRRILPDETSLDFVPTRWRPYVNNNPNPSGRRHHFEMCVL